MNYGNGTQKKSAGFWNEEESVVRTLQLLMSYVKEDNYGTTPYLLACVDTLREMFNIYIELRHDFYEDRVNVLVQFLCVKDGVHNNELCSGAWGDNGEFKDDFSAYVFCVKKAIERLDEYIKNKK